MKRHGILSVLAALLAFGVLLSLSACRKANVRNSASDRPSSSTTSITPQAPVIAGPVYDPLEPDSAGLTSPVPPDTTTPDPETADLSAVPDAENPENADGADGTMTALSTESAEGVDPAEASSDYQKGYMAGEAAGYAQGYKAGYDEGGGLGYDNGYKAGRTAGYAEIAGLVTSRIADATE